MKRVRILLLLLAVVSAACSASDTPVDGSVIFANNCASCHADDLSGTEDAAPLDGGSEGAGRSDAEYAEAIRSGPGIMPLFRNLSDVEIDAVIAYLRQLQRR